MATTSHSQSNPQAQSQSQSQSQADQQQYYYAGNQRYTSVGAQVLNKNGSSPHPQDEDDDDEDDEDDELYMDQQNQINTDQHSYNDPNQPLHNPDGELDDEADRASDSSFSDSVSLSSTPSIPCSDDIDFTLVYALHTFLATVEGQASVVKGDQLTLLDDSNSYWWLIRVLKTQSVGYIPAENIETPYERLARLNKHRNVDLSSATPIDVEGGAASSLAQTRFAQRIPSAGDPVRSRSPQDRRKGPGPPPMPGPGTFSPPPVAPAPGTGKGKTVAFTAPTYFEHSGNEWSDDGEGESGDEQMMSGDEGGEGDWEAEGEFGEEGEEGFEDEEEDSEDEDDDDDDHLNSGSDGQRDPQRPERVSNMDIDSGPKPGPSADSQRQLEEQLSQEHKQQQRQQQLQQQIQHQVASEQSLTHTNSSESDDTGKGTSGWARLRLAAKASADSLRGNSGNASPTSKDDSRSQLGKGLSPAQRAQLEPTASKELTPQQQVAQQNNHNSLITLQPNGSSSKGSLKSVDSNHSLERTSVTQPLRLNPGANTETKKLTLTPDIARDTPELGSGDVYQQTVSRPAVLTRQRSTSSVSGEGQSAISPRSRFTLNDQHIREEDASLDGHPQSVHSIDSYNGGSEDGKGGKRPSSRKDEQEAKKKKSGGLLSGFFGRKKDKKAGRGSTDSVDETRPSSFEAEQARSSSPSSQSESASLSPLTPETTSGGPAPGRRPRAESNAMFSTDAALKKQQAEAQEVMYRQYGISRQATDTVNTTVFNSQANRPSLHQLISPIQTQPLGSNSPFSPVSPSGSNGVLSPTTGPTPRIRPGSLIGSPSVPGMEVPMLNVLRIFAGDNVDCEATFKTVLLSEQTSTKELILQSMQRFRLPSDAEDQRSYYLTIKDVVSGEETKVADQQMPLKVFEMMNESLGQNGLSLPSVKRSSVGSISSISSNLSLNPAISRLGMSDFSDDSAVKFYINRYTSDGERSQGIAKGLPLAGRKNERTGALAPIQEDSAAINGSVLPNGPNEGTHQSASEASSGQQLATHDPQDSTGASGRSSAGSSNSDPNPSPGPASTSPSLRFAMRIQIYPNDLPDGLVFDHQSQAIIPKNVLSERGKRNSSNSSSSSSNSGLSPSFREKVMLFPRNINVSEAIEHTLEAFGIAEGVVDGGDDIEDKFSKRRSALKVRYGLSMKLPNSQNETAVNLTSKVLDAYSTPPTFRPAERSSKDIRRRSQEHSFVLGNLHDILLSDPVFILRRASPHRPSRRDSSRNSASGLAGAVADELGLIGPRKTTSNATGSRSVSQSHTSRASSNPASVSPSRTDPDLTRPNGTTSGGSAAEMIAAQRAAFLSATRNSEQGIDITLKDHGRIRSRRAHAEEAYRYSYIDPAGAEYDISEVIESEWSPVDGPGEGSGQPLREHAGRPGASRLGRRGVGASQSSISSFTEDGYTSAPESPVMSSQRLSMSSQSHADEDDEVAISALCAAPLTIDRDQLEPAGRGAQAQTWAQLRDLKRRDLLMSALEKQRSVGASAAGAAGGMGEHGRGSGGGAEGPVAETLEKRIERVLAKVKTSNPGRAPGGPGAGASGARRTEGVDEEEAVWREEGRVAEEGSHLSGLTVSESRGSVASQQTLGAGSAVAAAAAATVVAGAVATAGTEPSEGKRAGGSRGLQGSQTSLSSSRSNSTTGSTSPATPVTATSPTGESTYTPISSATRGVGIDSRQSSHRVPVGYRDELGVEVLMNLIESSAEAGRKRRGSGRAGRGGEGRGQQQRRRGRGAGTGSGGRRKTEIGHEWVSSLIGEELESSVCDHKETTSEDDEVIEEDSSVLIGVEDEDDEDDDDDKGFEEEKEEVVKKIWKEVGMRKVEEEFERIESRLDELLSSIVRSSGGNSSSSSGGGSSGGGAVAGGGGIGSQGNIKGEV